MPDKYDLIVIGGGPGGLEAAQRSATAGKRVMIIEKTGWGGTCTHRGCIPTKALLACSGHYANLKKIKRMGVNVTSSAIDFSVMKKHQQQMVNISALGSQKMLKDAGVEIKVGTGEILSPQEVKLTDTSGKSEIFTTSNIVVAWGSEPQVLPNINLSERILTSDGILNLNTLPQSIIIVGGSFIGCEFATFFAELGVKVTLIELLEHILPQEDKDISSFLHQELSRAGVTVHSSTQLIGLQETNGVAVQAKKNSEQMEWSADYVLLCTGRKPLLNEGELKNSGIAYDRKGIKVDKNMITNIPGIYAVGDVTGGMLLAHRATQQGKVAAAHICRYDAPLYNENFIPAVVYSHPQIARVGFTESQVRATGLEDIEIVQAAYSANIMARTELAGQGLIKAIFHQDKLIGITIAGIHASELISSMSLAVSGNLSRKQMQSWVIPHPTLSEIFSSIFYEKEKKNGY